MKDEGKMLSTGLLEGDLVQVLNEFGTLSLPAIYLGTVRPGYVGLWEDDLLWELEHVEQGAVVGHARAAEHLRQDGVDARRRAARSR